MMPVVPPLEPPKPPVELISVSLLHDSAIAAAAIVRRRIP